MEVRVFSVAEHCSINAVVSFMRPPPQPMPRWCVPDAIAMGLELMESIAGSGDPRSEIHA